MKIHCIVFAAVLAAPAAQAQTFMTEEEMLATFPGSTITGIANSDGKTRWTQVYSEAKKGKAKGTIKGDYAGDPYDAKWYIRKGQWCENWGSGKACWDMERVDDTHVRLYRKGEALEHLWELM